MTTTQAALEHPQTRARRPYTKPSLAFVGTVAELTGGAGGSIADGVVASMTGAAPFKKRK